MPHYTDPVYSLEENYLDRFRDVKHGDVMPPDASMPFTVTLKTLIEDYNNSDVATQLKFVELLVAHDFEKIQEALNKKGN